MWKKFWHWLRMEDENGKPLDDNPEELTDSELCECLSNTQIDSDEFLSKQEIDEGYAAIDEAIRRLNK